MNSVLICLFVFTSFISLFAQTDTIIVNNTRDAEDFGGAQQVADLPGPDGLLTLREAITAANNTIGSQAIHFNIPTNDDGFNGSTFVIMLDSSPQYTINDDSTRIDGTSQTDFTGDTNPNGQEIHLRASSAFGNYSGLDFNSNYNTVKGIDSFDIFRYGIRLDGDHNTVQTNSISGPGSGGVYITGSNNWVGGTAPGERNVIHSDGVGVWITGESATDNTVVGNRITSNYSGGVQVSDLSSNNIIGGPTEEERNIIAGNGHIGEERTPVGEQVDINSDNNTVEGNYIGVDEDGETDITDASTCGVEIEGSFNKVLDNVISGINWSEAGLPKGVCITGESHDNTVQGNLIGTDATGSAAVPNRVGVAVLPLIASEVPYDNTIGGVGDGESNIIAHSDLEGIFISELATTIKLGGNSIYSNGQLGIDLNNDGVTMNDAGDTDSGANNLQNFPVITSADDDGSNTTVTGTIDTQNPTSLSIELFSNDSTDASGYGEGQTYQGSTTPDANGDFTALLPGGLGGKFISATATDADGNTSEFSLAEEVTFVSDIAERPNVISDYKLYNNFPNPFNPKTQIIYDLPTQSKVTIEIFNIAGQLVSTLVDNVQSSGRHQITWDAGALPSGIYFYKLTANGKERFDKTMKMALVK
ncbi:MAG: T9SS type A sorting domain-containing protein [Caldithrix sp.]|nr:T9SS type A sorting domain-containing protein [Caldithrix sp.]